MHLLLKHNYLNLDVTRFSNEAVSVKTEDGSDWEHLVFHDFISFEDFKLISSTERKVACSAWRNDFIDPWQYLGKDEYAVGVVITGKLYIVLKDGKPLVKSSNELNETKSRPKGTVTTLLS